MGSAGWPGLEAGAVRPDGARSRWSFLDAEIEAILFWATALPVVAHAGSGTMRGMAARIIDEEEVNDAYW